MQQQALDDLLEVYRWRTGIEDPWILDWTGTMRVHTRITDPPVRDARPDAPARNTVVYGPAGDVLTHPDGSLQIVVITDTSRHPEAARVARDLVVLWQEDGTVLPHWCHEPRRVGPEVTVAVETTTRDPDALAAAHAAARLPHVPDLEILFAVDDGCGRAAARNEVLRVARGGLFVVLGEHVVPQPGWLRPLVRVLREHADVGAVGGLLTTEDGTVVDAGGVLLQDGRHRPFGAGDLRAGDPLVEHVRDVPFAGGRLLATRTGLVRHLGGWDLLMDPADIDADLGLRMRLAGRRSVHQPQTHAHAAGDPGAGVGVRVADPEARERFTRRWTTLLPRFPAAPAGAPDWAALLAATP